MGKFVPILVLVLGSTYFLLTRDNYDPKTVAGKRVLVTGASSGIGEELAYHYSRLGARLVLTARRAELLERVSEQCVKLGAKEVSVVPADMAESKDRIKVLEHTKKKLGGLDHLILNHALMRMSPWRSTPENMTNLQGDMNVNFFSFVEMASRALPMLTESQGRIGVVSSVAGKVGSPLATTYCASKFAMQGFFSGWRQELIHKGTGVSVTIAVLGPIATDAAFDLMNSIRPDFTFESIAATAKDTAEAIVRAVETRAYELYFGWVARIFADVHKFIPETMENYLGRDTFEHYKL